MPTSSANLVHKRTTQPNAQHPNGMWVYVDEAQGDPALREFSCDVGFMGLTEPPMHLNILANTETLNYPVAPAKPPHRGPDHQA